MKKTYIIPQSKTVIVEVHRLCNISGNKATLDNSDDNAVGAGSSLSRGASDWDDED